MDKRFLISLRMPIALSHSDIKNIVEVKSYSIERDTISAFLIDGRNVTMNKNNVLSIIEIKTK